MPRVIAAAALAALAFAHPVVAQVRVVSPQTVPVQPAPSLVSAPHQPTMLELQAEIEALTAQVEALSERLGSLNQHIATMSGDLGMLKARESTHFAKVEATAYQTCRLLYQHHWAGVTGHSYLPDDYCIAAGWQDQFAD